MDNESVDSPTKRPQREKNKFCVARVKKSISLKTIFSKKSKPLEIKIKKDKFHNTQKVNKKELTSGLFYF